MGVAAKATTAPRTIRVTTTSACSIAYEPGLSTSLKNAQTQISEMGPSFRDLEMLLLRRLKQLAGRQDIPRAEAKIEADSGAIARRLHPEAVCERSGDIALNAAGRTTHPRSTDRGR
jgi:hypothetical protein